jgi:DnaJ-class molecular chaperone
MLALTAALLVASAHAALPTPPQKVVFKNRKGDVTLDHTAHLSRRARCAACHGPGVVAKIEGFEMQRAHLVCVGCHRESARGPILCKDCHGGGPAAVPASGAEANVPGEPPAGS